MKKRWIAAIGIAAAIATFAAGNMSVGTNTVYAQEAGAAARATELASGMQFDKGTGKLTITSDFKWQSYPWQGAIWRRLRLLRSRRT